MTGTDPGLEVAIVGMAGRFPGAPDTEALWRNLCAGVSGVVELTDEELRSSGVPDELLARTDYVRAAAVIDGEDLFDADYFGYSPAEAALIDPQQRLFLETAAVALQNAGHDPRRYDGRIGVFGSASANTYLLNNVWPNARLHRTFDPFTLLLGGEKDYVATRAAYKLHLTGPALSVQSACSSSLVAVHLAAQSLVAGECDMALAGGVTVRVPQRTGHLSHESGIGSPDGVCRPFDARGEGTLTGNGVALVVLKRLEDALGDGDTVLAVVRGSAVTNDGAAKVGFTSPSVSGQSAAIRAALEVAGVSPATIGYVEAHGTATPLGDPIEVAALTEAFGGPGAGPWCALGSVKSNIGHLDAAAGVVGLIKAALCVRHGLVPPSLNFDRPNPHIDFANSPFFVNTRLREWPLGGTRRAGVNSMGIGGTNAHVVLEEPPSPQVPEAVGGRETIVLSARTPEALRRAADELADHLDTHQDLALRDVAWTTRVGRPNFAHRRTVTAADAAEAAASLRAVGRTETARNLPGAGAVWMFSGQGTQHAGMARGLYDDDAAFRAAIGECAGILRAPLGADIRELLYGTDPAGDEAVRDTRLAQPLLFSVGYAMAEALRERGLRPAALIGHSVGEYVAAQQAGVFSLADALAVVAARGRLVSRLPRGAMLTVPLPSGELTRLLPAGVTVAAVNGPALCVAAGPAEALAGLADRLAERGVTTRRLRVSHAFHTAAMDPAADSFREALRGVALRPPAVPLASNVTGGLLTAGEATDPEYWVRQLRSPVLFHQGLATLVGQGHRVFAEIAARPALGRLVRRHAAGAVAVPVQTGEQGPGGEQLADAVARLWSLGVPVDWQSGRRGEIRRRVPLPPYPFERARHWVEPPDAPRPEQSAGGSTAGGPAPERPQPDAVGGAAAQESGAVSGGGRLEGTRGLVADLWSELTGVPDVGAEDDFFALGGHSLLATQVFARVRERFGLTLPVREIFDHPRLDAFSDRIDALVRVERAASQKASPAAAADPPGQAPAAEPVGQAAPVEQAPAADPSGPGDSWADGGTAPLTSSQHSIWFLQQLAPASAFYTLANRARIRGPFDVAALEAAVRELVRRNAILRTTFPLERRRPVQRVHPAAPGAQGVAFDVVELGGLTGAEADRAYAAAQRDCLAQVRDLTRRPPFAVTVLRRGTADHDLVVALHHIAADHWSTGLLFAQLFELYAALAAGRPAPAARTTTQFADFAAEERRTADDPSFGAQLDRWAEVFRDPPEPLRLPGQGERPLSPAHAGGWQPVRIPSEVARGVSHLAREVSGTPFMVLLTAFAVQLNALSGQRDLCLGTYAGNRPRRELESVIGLFARTVALRMDIDPGLTFRGLVAGARAVCLDAFDRMGVSVDQLLGRLDLPREPGRNPLFQAMLVLESSPHTEVRVPGVDVAVEAVDTAAAKLDLLLALYPDGAGFHGFLEYSRDLFTPAAARDLAAGFLRTVERVVARPDEAVATVLSDAD